MTAHVEARHITVTGDDLTPPRSHAAHTLEGVIFYALLSLIALATVPYGTVHEWWDSLLQCAVFALAALWAVEGLLAGKWLVHEHLLLVPLVPLLVFVFLQSVPLGRDVVAGVEVWRTLSADAYETRLAAFRFLALLLFAAMLLRYTLSRRRLGALVCVVIGIGVSSALFGLVRQTMHREGAGFILPNLRPQLGFGQFINTNHFALLMEMCLGLLLGLAAGGGGRRRGVRLFLYLSAAALLLAALVRSTSRGGIFSAAGQIVFLALLWDVAAPRRQRGGGRKVAGARRWSVLSPMVARLALTACLLCVVGLCAVWIGGDKLRQRMETLRVEFGARGAGSRDYPPRIEMWRATWRMFKDHPLAGAGFGGYWLAVDRYYDASGVGVPEQAHNDYLELLASGGLVAAAAAALFVGGFIKRARECLHSPDPFRRAACFGALAGLFGVALHSFVDFGLHITANALVFTSLFVIAAAHVRADEHCRPARAGRTQDRPIRQSFKDSLSRAGGGRVARGAVAVICLLVCPALMWTTARAGLSRWHSVSRAREYSLRSAERAVSLSPHDPVARYFRAELLAAERRNGEAVEEFCHAIALRPRAHFLWIRLGLLRETGGDLPGALAAFQEAIRLAPFYAQPRWVLGGAFLRAGERGRALAEFSLAIASDPTFPQQMLELLWEASGGNAGEMARAISPQSAAARIELARFFVERGRTTAAAALLRQAGDAAEAERRAMTAYFISAKRFGEAYEIWSSGREAGADAGSGRDSLVTDGGFEGEINPKESGFGWRVAVGPEGGSVSPDTQGPRAGTRSLRLDFDGEAAAQSPLVSQLVLVEADSRYRLSFAARAREMKTAGPPVLTLTDAGGRQLLARPLPLPGGTVGWRDYAVEFKTSPTTTAVLIAFRRQCPAPPCLVKGRVWLDDFSLRRLTMSKTALSSSTANSSLAESPPVK